MAELRWEHVQACFLHATVWISVARLQGIDTTYIRCAWHVGLNAANDGSKWRCLDVVEDAALANW